MEEFTFEERNLICIYNTRTRKGVITALEEMRKDLEADETELLELTNSTIGKLNAMTDNAFEKLELYPDF